MVEEVLKLPEKVISGGQTGADQAGLAAAARFGIPTGGWMPRGWKTAAGPDSDLARRFGLEEHEGDYADRTEANIRESDATVRLAASFQTLGEKCTLKWLRRHHKPFIDVDMNAPIPPRHVADWITRHRVRVLNVAGNVEPKSKKAMAAGIGRFAEDYLAEVFRLLGHAASQDAGEGS